MRLRIISGSAWSSWVTTSTTVCWAWSLSITATSPNWRWASISTTGRSERWASTTPRLVAVTDLPEPPLVENTVSTRPNDSSPPVAARGVPELDSWVTVGNSPSETRVTVSIS
ncbi:MAG: hypothetical protein R2761_02200 [Acidimicrobiales bacterium]